MKFTQKWCVVSLLEEVEEGRIFVPQDWPVHATLLPTFAVSISGEQLTEVLHGFSSKPQIKTRAIEDVRWGSIVATLLENVSELQQLHNDLIRILSSHDMTFNEPMYIGRNYKPHVTVQKNGRKYPGDEVAIDSLTLVDMFPASDGHKRKIIKTIKLAAGENQG